jgi:hypothetical protein
MISRSSPRWRAELPALFEAMVVVHQHEGAVDHASRRGIRHDADRHPPANRIRARHQPLERRRFALQRARQQRLRARIDAVADDVAQAKLGNLLRGQAEILQERPVDILAALVPVDIGNRRRHAVHDRAQLRFPRSQRVLCLLQVGDVVADDVITLDRRVEAHVRDDLVAQPPLAAVDVDGLALVGNALAPGARSMNGCWNSNASGPSTSATLLPMISSRLMPTRSRTHR